ncbi:M1 family metallopeptidase [Clostridium ganghwense]|uniref:M1 family metallopeptidase n=1 Tax=Clostridium ganghwense TaxID=312089 RepID=A0ABT4CMB1_9CLOT|nr:M1 family metallopeptidase [Clostridium ganghwense]MCY6369598.1 M1 family metallopeptidase [Clostridium ganghwense]
MKNIKLKKFTCFIVTLLFMLLVKLPMAFAQEGANSYKINATFDENKKILTANETVSFKNTSNTTLKDIVFHLYPDAYGKAETKPQIGGQPDELSQEQLGDITITKVFVNNKKVDFTQKNQILKIKLDQALQNTEEAKLYIEFTLKLPHGTDRMGYFNDIYSFTNWYPILSIYDSQANKWDENPYHPVGESNYAESSNYDVTLNVSKDMQVASTGIDKSIDVINDKTKTININAENVRDFVFIMSPRFKVLSKDINGIKVNSFYYDEKDEKSDLCKKRASVVLDTAADALDFFSNKFGKYPFKEFDVVETYLSGGAMEYPQLIQMGNYRFNPEISYENAEYMPFEIESTVHETGHQWWFSLVGNNEFKESFLDESLTVYSTAYFFEKKYGDYCHAGTVLKFRMYHYFGFQENHALNTSVNKFDSWMDYSRTIYNKGPLFFEDLRQRVGEEKFLKILQTYFQKYQYKNATIKDLLDVIEEVAGKDVRKAMYSAVTSKDYTPKNISLSDEERNKIEKELYKNEVLSKEKKYGLSLFSIDAKAILGEKIYIVKPHDLPKEDDAAINNFIQNMKYKYKELNGNDENLIVKYDKDLTDKEIQNENLILLGNPWNNSAFNSLNSLLPISLSKFSLTMKDINICNSNVNGRLVAKNPYNKDKNLLVIFWSKNGNLDNLIETSIFDDARTQFSININNKKKLSGSL